MTPIMVQSDVQVLYVVNEAMEQMILIRLGSWKPQSEKYYPALYMYI